MGRAPEKRAVLIAGPTASGKSALAVEKARALGGVVVNTDAMQVYDILRVLTARPSADEMGGVPHELYGFVTPARRFSTGDWLRAVAALLPKLDGQTPVFVGGTGLYFDALINGFAAVPEVPQAIVEEIEAEIAGMDQTSRGRLIRERDPETARLLRAPDPQRVVRALAVLKATGRSLASFQRDAQTKLLAGYEIERIILDPPRDTLRERIGRRFGAMFESGAVDEVRRLGEMDLDPGLPAMKAIGVREIGDWLEGRASKEEAVERAITATRQYAKRQRTWLRGRMTDWTRADSENGA